MNKIIVRLDPGDPFVIEETMKAGETRPRRIDVVEQWHIKKAIDDKQLAAARQFAAVFDCAGFQDRYSVQCFDRVDGGGFSGEPERVLMAKDNIRQAMYVVGQVGGSALWDIVGIGMTMQEYCKRHTWTRANQTVVKGALIGALSSLVSHWRI